jgi:hypothetical protein
MSGTRKNYLVLNRSRVRLASRGNLDLLAAVLPVSVFLIRRLSALLRLVTYSKEDIQRR